MAFLLFVAAGVLFYMAVRNGREHSLHDMIFKRVDGSAYLALAILLAIVAFFLK